jgi:glycosyltransferase involved in cell wall biosynthesis
VALKGVEFLLTAISMLDPALDVALDLVYQVPTEEPALRRQAEQLGLRRVRFLGARPPAELARVYAGSHLLVLPSVTEALPSVVSEALFVGRPVVATDVGAVAEQVGDFGQIVAPRDPVALARAIEGILAGYDGYVSASADASRAAVARYSVGAMVDGHERMYARLAEIEPAQRGAAARVGDGAVRLAAGVRFGR